MKYLTVYMWPIALLALFAIFAPIAHAISISCPTATDGDVLTCGAAGTADWQAGGGVSKVGTPVDSQVGVWTGDGTLEGTSGLTYDGASMTVSGNAIASGHVLGQSSTSTVFGIQAFNDGAATAPGEGVGGVLMTGENPTASNNDYITIEGRLDNSVGAATTAGRIRFRLTDITSGSEDGDIIFDAMTGGTLGVVSVLSSDTFRPPITGGVDLGTSSHKWEDLYISGNANVGGNANVSGNANVGGYVLGQSSTSTVFGIQAFNDAVPGLYGVGGLLLTGENPTASDKDYITIEGRLDNSVGVSTTTSIIRFRLTDVTSGSEDGDIVFDVMEAGTITPTMVLSANAFRPAFTYPVAIGTVDRPWSDLHVSGDAFIGGTINGNDVVLSELSADPSTPSEGAAVLWLSDGTGTGNDGEIWASVTAGAATDDYLIAGHPSYGIMSVQGNSTGESTVDGTPRIITAWNTDGVESKIDVDHTVDYIQVADAGVYQVAVSISFSGSNNSTVQIELYVYDDSATSWSATGFALDRKLGAGGDVGSAGVQGMMALDADDRIALYQSSDGSAITVTEAQMVVHLTSD